jgi:hypothetical protein
MRLADISGFGRSSAHVGESYGPDYFSLTHPEEVLKDRTMTKGEKRALLASWLSDIRAVEHLYGYRQLDNGALVQLRDIYDALRKLDEQRKWSFFPQCSAELLRRAGRKGSRDTGEDDDDPPPAPAGVGMPWPRQLKAA